LTSARPVQADPQLAGCRALITGAASGLGRVMATAFADAGARVHAADVDGPALESMCVADARFSGTCTDVSQEAEVARCVAEAAAAMDGVDVLVNCAGIAGPTANVEEVDPDDWRRTLEVDITGTFLCTRAVVPHLKAAGRGSIVNLSSSAGRMGFARRSPYASAKWAVVGFTKTISIELGPFDVNVNCLQPGAIPGERLDRVIAAKAEALETTPEALLAERLRHVSMGRFASAEDIAATAVFLCSPAGHAISGQVIAIDGDQTALL
jgi:NAD(P)-dependent dehydrogenase (short-subunit alcohol dehydrogenase family)